MRYWECNLPCKQGHEGAPDTNNYYKKLVRECSPEESPCSSDDQVLYNICKPIDGGWSNFSQFGECERETDNSAWFRTLKRNCSNPEPKYGGMECQGSDTASEECKAINGQWSEFPIWSDCSDQCTKIRNRSCSSPEPKYGGKDCEGISSETKFCIDSDCQHDGCYSLTDIRYQNTANLSLEEVDYSALKCQQECQKNAACNYFKLLWNFSEWDGCWMKEGAENLSDEDESLNLITGIQLFPKDIENKTFL